MIKKCEKRQTQGGYQRKNHRKCHINQAKLYRFLPHKSVRVVELLHSELNPVQSEQDMKLGKEYIIHIFIKLRSKGLNLRF